MTEAIWHGTRMTIMTGRNADSDEIGMMKREDGLSEPLSDRQRIMNGAVRAVTTHLQSASQKRAKINNAFKAQREPCLANAAYLHQSRLPSQIAKRTTQQRSRVFQRRHARPTDTSARHAPSHLPSTPSGPSRPRLRLLPPSASSFSFQPREPPLHFIVTPCQIT